MIQAVFDTNVLASMAVATSGPVASLLNAWKQLRIDVVVSALILAELDHALGKPYFVTRLDALTREEYLLLARETTTIATVTAPFPLLRLLAPTISCSRLPRVPECPTWSLETWSYYGSGDTRAR